MISCRFSESELDDQPITPEQMERHNAAVLAYRSLCARLLGTQSADDPILRTAPQSLMSTDGAIGL